jgi:UDP-N-acetylmuramate--alanine ligase
MGHVVSASDVRQTEAFARVAAAGVSVHLGHDPALVVGVDAVTHSPAVKEANVELVAARSLGVPVLSRAAMLGAITACARSVGVAGTHGKTTTTSMLAMILDRAGLDPGFVVGGEVHDAGTGARWTGSDLFVVEADESDGSFLALALDATILTNVEVDHLDHFGTREAIVEGFDRYLGQIAGVRLVCADDPTASGLAARHAAITYGSDDAADYRMTPLGHGGAVQRFSVDRSGTRLGDVTLPLRGLHMARNATAAIAMALELGATFADAQEALAVFGGVGRRFETRGELQGATLVDDYAHLPSEIGAVLEAAATSGDGWTRIVAVFQPNRFSRMAVLSPEYRDAFVHADLAVLTDVYPSGESPLPGVTGKLVVDAVLDAHPSQRVAWMRTRDDLVSFLVRELRPGDVCISMGCGDIAALPDELLQRAGAARP